MLLSLVEVDALDEHNTERTMRHMIDEQRLEKLGIVKQDKIDQRDYEQKEVKFFEVNLMNTIERCENKEVRQVWYKKFNWLQLNMNKYINYLRLKNYVTK
jgi:hypothetical protein